MVNFVGAGRWLPHEAPSAPPLHRFRSNCTNFRVGGAAQLIGVRRWLSADGRCTSTTPSLPFQSFAQKGGTDPLEADLEATGYDLVHLFAFPPPLLLLPSVPGPIRRAGNSIGPSTSPNVLSHAPCTRNRGPRPYGVLCDLQMLNVLPPSRNQIMEYGRLIARMRLHLLQEQTLNNRLMTGTQTRQSQEGVSAEYSRLITGIRLYQFREQRTEYSYLSAGWHYYGGPLENGYFIKVLMMKNNQ